MKVVKCPNCGANINVDELSDPAVCGFCDTPIVIEKEKPQVNNTQTIINNYYTTTTTVQSVPHTSSSYTSASTDQSRPRVNIFLAIFLFYFYIFPGIIYISAVKKRQKEWDKAHGK